MRYYCVFFSLCLTFSLKKFQGSLLIFSIVQFSRCCCRFLDSFIISHFEVFVKSFWKLFQINFFNVIATPKSDLIIIPQLVRFVKSFFQKPFRLNCESSVLQTTYLLYHFRTILSSIFWTFFKKTSENLYSKVQKRLSEKVFVRQLYYYIIIFRKSQVK